MSKRVYLAGPITGTTYGEATNWREEAVAFLAEYDIEGLSPMRGKEYLENEPAILDCYDHVSDWPLSKGKAFTNRDRDDVMTSDLIIANFTEAETVSIGTVIECAWADAFRKMLIIVRDPNNHLHDHAMLNEISAFHVETMEQALAIVPPILNAHRPPTVGGGDVQWTWTGVTETDVRNIVLESFASLSDTLSASAR